LISASTWRHLTRSEHPKNAVQQIFGNRIIPENGDIRRPPDLSACDFFSLGQLKSKVYAQKPRDIGEPKTKNKIREEIANTILVEMIHPTA